MNVVGHDHESVQVIMPEGMGVVADGFYDQAGKGWLAEVERAHAGLIQQTVQCGKGLPGGERTPWERSMRGQTAVEPPREKNRLFRGGDVRKPAPVKHHAGIVSRLLRDSLRSGSRSRPGGPARTRASAPPEHLIPAKKDQKKGRATHRLPYIRLGIQPKPESRVSMAPASTVNTIVTAIGTGIFTPPGDRRVIHLELMLAPHKTPAQGDENNETTSNRGYFDCARRGLRARCPSPDPTFEPHDHLQQAALARRVRCRGRFLPAAR